MMQQASTLNRDEQEPPKLRPTEQILGILAG
jgi:hypothetical protein